MRTHLRNIAQMPVDKRPIGSEKPTLDEQFRELAVIYRREVVEYGYSYRWLIELVRNWPKHSPKCRCWLARECFDEMSLYYGSDTMAQRISGDKQSKSDLPEWGFVNVQLSDDERTAAMLDFTDPDTMWDTLVVSLKDGYKVTLSYDGETDSYCAALSGTNCGKPNERLTLTAWGEDEITALKYLLYKHVTKLEFIWKKNGAKERRLG